MSFWPAIALFIGALCALLVSAELLVRASKKLSTRWRLSPIFVSLVVVALGTSLPELAVTISSLAQGDGGLAIGNIVGSNITNATLVFGLAVLTGTLKVGRYKTQRNGFLMLIVTGLFVFLQFSRWSGITQAGILFVSLVTILLYDSFLALRGRVREDQALLRSLMKKNGKPSLKVWLPILLVSIAILYFSGTVLVTSVNAISDIFGISTSILGLTLTATVTSFPEIITLLVAGFQGESKIALGTILGSNIYNLTLIGGIISFYPKGLTPPELANDMLYLILATIFLLTVVLMLRGKVVQKSIGAIGILFYFLFLITSIWV